jgi:hypothetical protein
MQPNRDAQVPRSNPEPAAAGEAACSASSAGSKRRREESDVHHARDRRELPDILETGLEMGLIAEEIAAHNMAAHTAAVAASPSSTARAQAQQKRLRATLGRWSERKPKNLRVDVSQKGLVATIPDPSRRCLRMAVPVYLKRNDVYELEQFISHDVPVPANASTKKIRALAENSTKSARAIVCRAGDGARVAGVTHETLDHKNFPVAWLGDAISSFAVSGDELDVTVNNQSSVVYKSNSGLTVTPVIFGQHAGFRRTVPACHISKYMRDVVRGQQTTLKDLIRRIVVVELHDNL